MKTHETQVDELRQMKVADIEEAMDRAMKGPEQAPSEQAKGKGKQKQKEQLPQPNLRRSERAKAKVNTLFIRHRHWNSLWHQESRQGSPAVPLPEASGSEPARRRGEPPRTSGPRASTSRAATTSVPPGSDPDSIAPPGSKTAEKRVSSPSHICAHVY